MKPIKKILVMTMALVLSASVFVELPVDVKAAGNIPDAYVGTYIRNGNAEDAVTVTKDNVSIAGVVPEGADTTEVVVNDSTVPSVMSDVALRVIAHMTDGTTEPYQYYALSFSDNSHNVLKVTQYLRSSDWAIRGDKVVLQWGEWYVNVSYEYQRQGVTEQPAQEEKAESAVQETKVAEVKTEAKTTKSNDIMAKKNYSTYAYSGTTAQELVRELTNYINTAEAGSIIEFTGKPIMMCYSKTILDKLAERGNVSLKTIFTCDGVTYSFTIPAGSDYSNLEDAKYYGFMYLCNAFNGSIEE